MVVVSIESPHATQLLELAFPAGEPIAIGRHPDNQVQLPDAAVSLRHALIRPAGDGYVVVDQGSTNGTRVNAEQLAPGRERAVAPGDVIQIGRARLRLEHRAEGFGKAEFSTRDLALAMVQGALLSSGSAVAPRLRVVAGPDQGLELVLGEERGYVLGREAGVELRLSDEDASRRHARVVRQASRLWVVDLGSRHGTRLDGRRLTPNVPAAWHDSALLELGQSQLAIEDPVSSALRNVEQAADERLGQRQRETGALAGDALAPTQAVGSRAGREVAPAAQGTGGGFMTRTEPKAALALSTSSSSSAPSAPIEVVRWRRSEPPRGTRARRSRWSVLDALVIGVATLTIALSVLALAWFLAS